MNDDPSNCRVGGVSPASRARSRNLTVTSSSVVARWTLSWTTFCGLAEVDLHTYSICNTEMKHIYLHVCT